jgi:hypothetical protein
MTPEELRKLVIEVADNDIANYDKARNYTYIEEVEERKLDGNGKVKSSDTKTYELMQLYGDLVARLTAKDGKPLSAKDAAKEEEKLRKLTKKRADETEEQRTKRLEKKEKERQDQRQFVREIADAYNIRIAGTEIYEGRETLVLEGDPKPGYKPKRKEAKFLAKFRIRAWIDETDRQWVKLDAEAIDDISFGWFLAKLRKGSRVHIEQTRVNDEVWLPRHVSYKYGGRALVKNISVEADVNFRDYKKFRTDVRISEPIANPR